MPFRLPDPSDPLPLSWRTRAIALLLVLGLGVPVATHAEADAATREASAETGPETRSDAPEQAANDAEKEDETSSTTTLLDATPIRTRRIPESLNEAPAAVSVVTAPDIQDARQQLTLDESLARVPGLFLQNRTNFAQDLRISSRGFGARSSFGIRGIKVFVDGIPATLPDGQAGVDSIDLGSTGRIEVLRGPASSLYGSAAGGVIHLHTEEPPDRPFVEGRVAFGAQGFARQQFKTAGRGGPVDYLLSLNRTHVDGYRNQSGARFSNLNGVFRWQVDPASRLDVIVNAVDAPKADDAGGLTRDEVHADRRQARARNLFFDTGEELDQQRLGLVYRRALGDGHEISARSYFVHRNFENRLPFSSGGQVDLDRLFVGGGLAHRAESRFFDRRQRTVIGIDVDAQRDRRRRYDNLEGGTRGALVFDQDEDVTALGVFAQGQTELGGGVELSIGARYDRVEFDVDDDFLANGDESGNETFDEFSPAVSMMWSPTPLFHLYGRFSTSFETPTTTEFANPSGGGGFNSSLDPQTATAYELGAKGLLPGRLRYELVLYHVDVDDELVPFELASMPGRTFFRNAGSSTRRGVEAAVAAQLAPGLTSTVSYTWSDLRYDRYRTPSGRFDGNRIPGAPRNQLFAELAYSHPWGFRAVWDALYVGHVHLNDANSAKEGSSLVSNLRLSWTIRKGPWEVTPFVGVTNLFDRAYSSNLRINAFGGRYFEPAPDRSLYGGIGVRLEFGEDRDPLGEADLGRALSRAMSRIASRPTGGATIR